MNSKSITTKKLFSRETKISTDIKASPEKIWSILTSAKDYPSWNSTVISIVGNILPGETIELKAKLAPDRVFKLKIKEFDRNKRLSWGDAMGLRTYQLETFENMTKFTMTERIGGPLFPLFANMIPSFDEAFEAFASDLKKVCEFL